MGGSRKHNRIIKIDSFRGPQRGWFRFSTQNFQFELTLPQQGCDVNAWWRGNHGGRTSEGISQSHNAPSWSVGRHVWSPWSSCMSCPRQFFIFRSVFLSGRSTMEDVWTTPLTSRCQWISEGEELWCYMWGCVRGETEQRKHKATKKQWYSGWGTQLSCNNDASSHMVHGIYGVCYAHIKHTNRDRHSFNVKFLSLNFTFFYSAEKEKEWTSSCRGLDTRLFWLTMTTLVGDYTPTGSREPLWSWHRGNPCVVMWGLDNHNTVQQPTGFVCVYFQQNKKRKPMRDQNKHSSCAA